MVQKQRLVQIGLPATVLLGILVAVYLLVGRRSSQPDIAKHSVETPPADALKYWTKDRMRDAQPITLPETKDLKHKKKHSHKGSKAHKKHS